jgi:hypothetical protein
MVGWRQLGSCRGCTCAEGGGYVTFGQCSVIAVAVLVLCSLHCQEQGSHKA